MLALRSAPPLFSIAEAERIARDVYGLALSMTPLSGERDCNFHARAADGPEYVLKIVDGDAEPQATDCQVRVLRHLAEQDAALRVPKLIATQQGEDLGSVEQDNRRYATCVTAYLPGQLLAGMHPPESVLRSLGTTLARLDRALRGFFHPALSQRIAWDVRRLPELIEFAAGIESAGVRRDVEAVGGALQECLPTLRGLRSQAIHGDAHAANVLVDPAAAAVCGILDFGDMIHAPLILELAVALSELLTDGVVEVAALSSVLEAYALDQPLEAREIAVLYDLVTARHAVTLVLHAWRSRHDPAGARVLEPAAERAGRSLEALRRIGRDTLTHQWQAAAGTGNTPVTAVDLGRRRRLLGSGAELFYETPLQLVRGEAVWLYDAHGRAYLDAYNNVPQVGHCHPVVVRAVQRQSAVLATHTRYLHPHILDYADALTGRCAAPLNACIFVNSGSEANDVAWRLAQFATGHRGGIVMAHAYHGITDAVAALTPGAGHPHDPRVVTLAAPPAALRAYDAMPVPDVASAVADADSAVRLLASRGHAPAAFFIDSALTSSGIFDPPPAWLAAVAARVRAAGGLVVADEVQYGLGRSGSHFWGFERRGVAPDIVTLGKPIGNGYPMGVVIAERALIEAFQARYGLFSTFGGNPVAAAAGLAVLRVIDREQLMDNARITGEYLRGRLAALAERHPWLGGVRGAGLLLGMQVTGADARSAKARTVHIVNHLAARARVLIGSEGPACDILKVRPPLVFRTEHADLLVQAIAAAAQVIDSGVR